MDIADAMANLASNDRPHLAGAHHVLVGSVPWTAWTNGHALFAQRGTHAPSAAEPLPKMRPVVEAALVQPAQRSESSFELRRFLDRVLAAPEAQARPCQKCDGDGTVCAYCTQCQNPHDMQCCACDGTGHGDEPPMPVRICGQVVNARVLRRPLELHAMIEPDDIAIDLCPAEDAENEPLVIRPRDGERAWLIGCMPFRLRGTDAMPPSWPTTP